jgi:hypothetical protein
VNDIYAIALSWAVSLTGYPMPRHMPEVREVPHSYFVEHACNGHECKVMGWFPPGDTIYLDARLKPREDLYASSVVVHEMVHYLQSRGSNRRTQSGCRHAIEMEYEAYGAQGQYLTQYGEYRPVGLSMHSVSCEREAFHPAASH